MKGAAPIGAVVSLTYDTEREVAEGHYLRTKTGRVYRVVSARRVRRKHEVMYVTPRWAISAVVDERELPAEHPKVHNLVWYSRDKK